MNGFIRQCCQCWAVYDERTGQWEPETRLLDASHGYCNDCLRKAMGHIQARRETDAALVSYTKARDAA